MIATIEAADSRLLTGMYDICHCGKVKRKCAIRCISCRSRESSIRMGKVKRTVQFQNEWLSLAEMHEMITDDMRKWNISAGQLADKAGCTATTLLDFLGGRAPLPKAVADYYGFARANAWVRL